MVESKGEYNMKNCNTYYEFMYGQSGTISISEHCGNKNNCIKQCRKKTNKDERKMNYDELRHKIHDILEDFLRHEIEICNAGEFDFEYMEFRTDDILRLIKRQGGTY
jgi:hypothetical protein